MRGRKPKPNVVKFLTGNPGRRRLNENEPKPGALSSACPEFLTGEAASEWNRTIVPAIETGQITAADRAGAIAHCELWATWREQLEEAAKHSHVVAVGPNKHPMPNPARTMANKTLQLLLKTDAELGCTPSSRSRVKVEHGRTTSRLDQFRAKKAGTSA